MRIGVVLSIIVFAGAGALFGGLNAERIGLDLYFVVVSVPKGAALLAALLLGWSLGGIVVWLGRVPRLKRELRICQRALRDSRQLAPPPDGTP
ncbi:MAG: DUF1049 domain-containing protein [Rhodanobacteraceae bacterium]